MASFAVLVRRIKVFPHPNADLLELAQVDDYHCVVKKGDFKTGDLIAYIPEASLVPEALLLAMNLQGRLAGAEKNPKPRPPRDAECLRAGAGKRPAGPRGSPRADGRPPSPPAAAPPRAARWRGSPGA